MRIGRSEAPPLGIGGKIPSDQPGGLAGTGVSNRRIPQVQRGAIDAPAAVHAAITAVPDPTAAIMLFIATRLEPGMKLKETARATQDNLMESRTPKAKRRASDSMWEEQLNARRFQFRIADLLLVTVVVALTIAAAKEGLLYGPAHSPILLVAFASILGAVTGRLASGAFRFGLVGGLLLGVFGFHLAVSASSLGVKTAAETLCLVCVSAGGVIGGLVPTMLHRWRRASFRSHMSILSVGAGLLILLAWRWWTVSTQDQYVEDMQAAGAHVYYSDVNPLPMILDSDRMDSRTEWLRKLLGLRVVTQVYLTEKVDHHYDIQLLVDNLPGMEDLSLHANSVDDEVVGLLNSGKLSRLKTLRFRGREFDDTSLSRLHPLPGLLLLDLEGTSVTDESVEHIATFPRLTILVVSETDITADGVKRLKSKIGRVVSSN